MYLVVTGSEFGIDLNVEGNVPFITSLPEAEKVYEQYLEDNDCAAMYKVGETSLELIKSDLELMQLVKLKTTKNR